MARRKPPSFWRRPQLFVYLLLVLGGALISRQFWVTRSMFSRGSEQMPSTYQNWGQVVSPQPATGASHQQFPLQHISKKSDVEKVESKATSQTSTSSEHGRPFLDCRENANAGCKNFGAICDGKCRSLRAASPAVCRNLCEENTACMAYSVGNQQDEEKTIACFLYSSDCEIKPDNDYITFNTCREMPARELPPPRQEASLVLADTNSRYVTWVHNLGGFNNQLKAYDAMFRLSRALNRTLYIPPPQIDKQWMNFEDEGEEFAIWDLSHLRKHFQFVTALEVEAAFGAVDKHPVLGQTVPGECRVNLFIGRFKWVEEAATKSESCNVVMIMSGSIWIEGDTSAYGVSRFAFYAELHLSKFIQEAGGRFFQQHQWGTPSVGVQLRTRIEGGATFEDKEREGFKICHDHLTPILKGWKTFNNLADDEEPILREGCLMNPQKLRNITHYYKFPDIMSVEHGKWILATDGQHPTLGKAMEKNGGMAYKYKTQDFQKQYDAFRRVYFPEGGNGRRKIKYFGDHCFSTNVRMALDFYLMLQPEYLITTPDSTVSYSICHMRGEDKIMKGNICRHMCQTYRM